MNSRNKGKVGEREFAALLREHGFDARRGQQFSGSPDSPDVVSDALAWLHFEVKRVQNLNLTDACVQAEGDQTKSGHTKKLAWVVAHRKNHAPWLITMRAEFFFDLIREFEPQMLTDGHRFSKAQTAGGDDTAHGVIALPTQTGAQGVLADGQSLQTATCPALSNRRSRSDRPTNSSRRSGD